MEFDIGENDLFLVIASDGVWEFLENEDVASGVEDYYWKGDLEGACEWVMKESYAKWTREDDSVVDDITFIIVFFEWK